MRRLLALLLLILAPLQFSWAAVSGFCSHESGLTTQHVATYSPSHAEHPKCHEHQGAAQSSQETPGIDHSCCQCHSHCHSIGVTSGLHSDQIKASSALPAVCLSPALPFGLIDRPERPKWPRLA
jgi:hypothetical protein